MGVEPTVARSARPTTDFEDRDDHRIAPTPTYQTLCLSVDCIPVLPRSLLLAGTRLLLLYPIRTNVQIGY